MDILCHALYGATLCSRTGLAGGGLGTPSAWRDWTLKAAVGFSLMPDLVSVGLAFTQMILRGHDPSWQSIPPHVFIIYYLSHSLVIAGLFVVLLGALYRPLILPALAWPVHIGLDVLLHGEGRWQVPLFFPFWDWRFQGVNWWQHREVVLTYMGILPLLWLAIHLYRRYRSQPTGPGHE